jgi:hypothetical protein
VDRAMQKFGLVLFVNEKKMVTYLMERKKINVFDRIFKFTPTTAFAFGKGLYSDSAGQL